MRYSGTCPGGKCNAPAVAKPSWLGTRAGHWEDRPAWLVADLALTAYCGLSIFRLALMPSKDSEVPVMFCTV